jgi:hypothetical protein
VQADQPGFYPDLPHEQEQLPGAGYIISKFVIFRKWPSLAMYLLPEEVFDAARRFDNIAHLNYNTSKPINSDINLLPSIGK